jgi:hypothetical protein
MAEIEAQFNAENARFIELMSRPHEIVGRLLKCHLVVEHYLDHFLSEHFGIEDVESAKLGFFNKAMLLPNKAASAAFVKPGILKLNTLRNRAGHNLGSDITFEDLGRLDPGGVQTLLRTIEKDRLALALKGASESLRDLFFSNMSERAANILREDMEAMGPVRLRDVDDAQSQVVAVAKELANTGKLVLASGRGEDELVY